MTAPPTMQSEAMLRSGALTEPATMQWGHLPLAGDVAMKRSGAW
jgi:hypothetical protein